MLCSGLLLYICQANVQGLIPGAAVPTSGGDPCKGQNLMKVRI